MSCEFSAIPRRLCRTTRSTTQTSPLASVSEHPFERSSATASEFATVHGVGRPSD